MSKTLGNVVDPMEVIAGCTLDDLVSKLRSGNLDPREVEKAVAGKKLDFPTGIPECGADALRFGLLAYTLQGRDVNLDINRVVGYRQFCNKLWNATRFALTHLAPEKYTPTAHVADIVAELTSGATTLAPRNAWILSRLSFAINAANDHMAAYSFASVCSVLHHFWLHELCDVYLELVKPGLYDDAATAADKRQARLTLYVCLEYGLRLLHPLMPFVTEELWQHLPGRGFAHAGKAEPPSIMLVSYPRGVNWANEDVEVKMATAQVVVTAARAVRASANISRTKKCEVFVRATDAATRAQVAAMSADICTLASGASLTVLEEGVEAPAGCATEVVSNELSVLVQLRGMVDFAAESVKITKKLAKLDKQIAGVAKKLANTKFTASAPAEVLAKEQEKMAALNGEVAQLKATMAQYAALA